MRRVIPITLAVLLFASPAAVAEGTLDVAPTAASGAADEADLALHFFLYGFYGTPATQGHHYKVAFEDSGRTWVLYQDADDDYRVDGGETLLVFPIVPLDVHGSGTDHVILIVPATSTYARLCTEDAAATDGAAAGLRCGGDMDGDGYGDFWELAAGTDPLRPGPGDRIGPSGVSLP